jgi:hypothetical protein
MNTTAVIITVVICLTLAFICWQGRRNEDQGTGGASEEQLRSMQEDLKLIKAILIARGQAKETDFKSEDQEP